MTKDQAKYLSGVAQNAGVINWAIVELTPAGSLEPVTAFRFEKVGNLPRIQERALDGTWNLFTVDVRQADDVVYIY